MLELMEGKLGESHSGELHRETTEQRRNRIITEELARRGWQESELATRRRSDPGKLAIAARPRSETTQPIKWIARGCRSTRPKGPSPCSIIWLTCPVRMESAWPSTLPTIPAPASAEHAPSAAHCNSSEAFKKG